MTICWFSVILKFKFNFEIVFFLPLFSSAVVQSLSCDFFMSFIHCSIFHCMINKFTFLIYSMSKLNLNLKGRGVGELSPPLFSFSEYSFPLPSSRLLTLIMTNKMFKKERNQGLNRLRAPSYLSSSDLFNSTWFYWGKLNQIIRYRVNHDETLIWNSKRTWSIFQDY